LSSVLIIGGVLVLVVTGVDVLWTVLAPGSGAGPITARLSALAWRVALRVGRRGEAPRHALLAVFGVAIVVGMLLSWSAVVFGAWWLISSATDGAVRIAGTGQPAGLLERAYFVGYNYFTLGTNTYQAGDGLWQLLPVAVGASGLVALTIGISYLVPVASAVAERRQLAQYILALGQTPTKVAIQAWGGSGFGSLAQHLVALTPMVHLAGERHLTYPALAYFHSAREQASSSLSMVVLDDALTLLRHGVAEDVRPDRGTVDALHRTLGSFLESVAGESISGDVQPLPPPDLQPLRAAGIPTVDDGTFAAALAGEEQRRRQLAGLLAHDGWTAANWEDRRRSLGG
jgi:hypothetical protein